MRKIAKLQNKGLNINEIDALLARALHITHNQLSQLKRSAFSKWNLFLNDTVQSEYDHIIG